MNESFQTKKNLREELVEVKNKSDNPSLLTLIKKGVENLSQEDKLKAKKILEEDVEFPFKTDSSKSKSYFYNKLLKSINL